MADHGLSKEISQQQIVDIRRMLSEAGYGPGGAAVEDQRDRNYGDNRWGKPEDEA